MSAATLDIDAVVTEASPYTAKSGREFLRLRIEAAHQPRLKLYDFIVLDNPHPITYKHADEWLQAVGWAGFTRDLDTFADLVRHKTVRICATWRDINDSAGYWRIVQVSSIPEP